MLGLATAACGSGSGNGNAANGAGSAHIILFAAASMAKVMPLEIAAFERAHPGATVDGDYEGTQSLLTKLQADPSSADVFLSADRSHMATALHAGLVANPSDLALNRLVIAVAPGNPAHITGIADLARPGVRLVLADHSVPAGSYAEQSLHAAEATGDAPGGSAAKALANVVSRETDVEAVVAKVGAGVADAGIVYATDAAANPGLAALAIPERDQPPSVDTIAVTTHARQPAAAASFLAFLESPAGRRILLRGGFVLPPTAVASP